MVTVSRITTLNRSPPFIWVRFCTKLRSLHLTLIFCLVLRLYGGHCPQYIVTKGNGLNDNDETTESKFYPLYDKILNHWFPATDGYDVCPQWTIPDPRKSVDFTVAFVVEHTQHPLLVVEIKAPSEFSSDSGRAVAIGQLIRRLDEIGPSNQYADRLYAISAVGKMWRACYTSKGNGSKGAQPVKGVSERNSLRSSHESCWNPDITSDASWAALESIVETIKSYVNQ